MRISWLLLSLFQGQGETSPEITKVEIPKVDLLSNESLARRFTRLQPALEKAIGEPFPEPVRFLRMEEKDFAALIGRENAEIEARVTGKPVEESTRESLEESAGTLARLCFAKLDLREKTVIRVCPAAFEYLPTVHKHYRVVNDGWFLDMLLLHEAAHVYQARKVDMFDFYSEGKDLPGIMARASVIEGMAQYYTEKAAKSLKLDWDWQQWIKVFQLPGSEDLLPEDEAQRAVLEFFNKVVGYPYTQGYLFVSQVVVAMGEKEGIARLFARPPSSPVEISSPKLYIEKK